MKVSDNEDKMLKKGNGKVRRQKQNRIHEIIINPKQGGTLHRTDVTAISKITHYIWYKINISNEQDSFVKVTVKIC